MKNKMAVGLGRLRWKGKSKAQKRAHMKRMADKATLARKADAAAKVAQAALEKTATSS